MSSLIQRPKEDCMETFNDLIMKWRTSGACNCLERSTFVAAGWFCMWAQLMVVAFGSFSFAQSPAEQETTSAPAIFTNSLGMRFRQIPGSPVMMSVWETRVSDWHACLQEQKRLWQHRPTFEQSDDHPVVNITVEEAMMFCQWLTKVEQESGVLQPSHHYRLPTQEEWDAAVGIASEQTEKGDPNKATQRFPWGNNWPPMRQSGNYNSRHLQSGRDDGFPFTAPVGQFIPVAAGFYDLGGNVWEWVEDGAPGKEPKGALRGGSWMYWRKECLESSYSYFLDSNTRSPTIGFRCVLEDSRATAEHHKRMESEESKMRASLKEDKGLTEEELARAKAQMTRQPAKEVDPEERAKLLEKPEVSQEEIEEFRKTLRGTRDADDDVNARKELSPQPGIPAK